MFHVQWWKRTVESGECLLFGGVGMFRGEILGVMYYTWNAYKRAWNEAVRSGKLVDKKGRKITKIYPE